MPPTGASPNDITVSDLKVFHVEPDRLVERLNQENGEFYAVVQDTVFTFERFGIVLR